MTCGFPHPKKYTDAREVFVDVITPFGATTTKTIQANFFQKVSCDTEILRIAWFVEWSFISHMIHLWYIYPGGPKTIE